MRETETVRKRTCHGPEVSRSRSSPLPLDALRSIEDMERPFVLGGAPSAGHRYSVAAAAPLMTITMRPGDGEIEIKNAPPLMAEKLRHDKAADPFALLAHIISTLRSERSAGPFPFSGGAVGVFSYDLKDSVFQLPPVPGQKKDRGIGLPLLDIGIYEDIYVYDHHEEKGYFISRPPHDKKAREFRERIEGAPSRMSPATKDRGERGTRLYSNTTMQAYLQAVMKAKEYIAAGDIYQINLSQRLETDFRGDPLSLYEALLRENPTPFSSYFDLGGYQIISNSPERLLRVRGDKMETSPIKGTRPRGSTPEEDALLRRELATSPKERAEHVMIVDLERNDLGRLALPGTVTVEDFEEIQSFRRLHHMVSRVSASTPPGTDPAGILREIFPGGSITGAPKIRAMEIIEELETVPREVYTGSAGYIDFSGSADLSILIRTAILKKDKLFLHVGGGIVADSDPASEYEETILKAMDFLNLLNLAPGQLA